MNLQSYHIDRFKRGWRGITALATLLEQTGERLRGEILELLEKENPDLRREVLEKTVFFEELIFLEESVLLRILTGVSRRVLAFALMDTEAAFREAILGHLPFAAVREILDEQDRMGKASTGQVLSARRLVLRYARHLEAESDVPLRTQGCPRLAGP